MTPDDQRRQFYQEQAEEYGHWCNIGTTAHKLEFVVLYARIAGHFGRLALGQTSVADMYVPTIAWKVEP